MLHPFVVQQLYICTSAPLSCPQISPPRAARRRAGKSPWICNSIVRTNSCQRQQTNLRGGGALLTHIPDDNSHGLDSMTVVAKQKSLVDAVSPAPHSEAKSGCVGRNYSWIFIESDSRYQMIKPRAATGISTFLHCLCHTSPASPTFIHCALLPS